ncbi:hypothetical protein BC629DRAFT_810924 [Irpex lacteus]|nr:hypothetical protein BC629DRAFT_810924 [Irpex lacteus]
MEMRSILQILDDDVLILICSSLCDVIREETQKKWFTQVEASLLPLSVTCKHFRALCIPIIFRTFSLECCSNDPWIDAWKKLDSWNTDYSPFVRAVRINLTLAFTTGKPEFVDALPGRLASVLHTFSQPEKVILNIHRPHAHLFEDTFIENRVVLPSVQRFVVSPSHAGIFKLCPNAISLTVQGPPRDTNSRWSTEVIEALPMLSKLQNFHLAAIFYTDEVMDGRYMMTRCNSIS